MNQVEVSSNLSDLRYVPKQGVQIISKSELSALTSMNVEGEETFLGEVRHFKSNPYLSQVLPKDLSIAWTLMPKQGELDAHFHPCESLILVCHGEGTSTGDTVADISSGDIVYIPKWNLHGFTGGGENGFTALSIQFQETAIFSSEEKPETTYIDRDFIPVEDRQLNIIPRDSLASINNVSVDGELKNLGVLKNFSQNADVDKILPDYFSAAWVHLSPGDTLEEHVHNTDSMIIITEGQGQLFGDTLGEISEGDIVYVPAGFKHGFTGQGKNGFWALSIQFQEESLYEDPKKPQVKFTQENNKRIDYSTFIELNSKYSKEFLKNPIFDKSIEPLLNNPRKKEKLLDCLQVMSDSFQRLMFSRMALSTSTEYRKIFFEHFMEELGHDQDLHKERNSKDTIFDPILESTTFWFFGQNFIIDDPGRIVMTQMVLEGGAHMFYSHFSRLLSVGNESQHISKHCEADEGHDSMGVDLLKGESSEKLAELCILMDKSWGVLNEFLARTAYLVHNA